MTTYTLKLEAHEASSVIAALLACCPSGGGSTTHTLLRKLNGQLIDQGFDPLITDEANERALAFQGVAYLEFSDGK